ncbi:hypothetical protein MSPP1_002985 [Malassezia sp. CBS 17886]|nr:hypothetical protein MSPP1_002985 [Malassezia sp. CBS 17886]
MSVRPLRAALNAHGHYAYKAPELRIDHLVIGAGAIGLAVANALARRWPEKSTYVVERHAQAGQEISSRNSEVIHAGLYYPADSLKTRFCIRGRDLLYDRAARLRPPIAHKRIGKLVVGRSRADADYLERLHAHCAQMEGCVPTELLSGDEARALEPDLSADISAALHSPLTGIVSAHDLMAQLEQGLDELPDGTQPDAQVVYGTAVVRIDPHVPEAGGAPGTRTPDATQEGWVVQTCTQDAQDTDALLARVVVNTAGLNAPRALNSLTELVGRDPEGWIPMYLAKGSYASYRGAGVGPHLTLDIDGNVRFGPDVQWLSPPADWEESDDTFARDFWASDLAPDATPAWFDQMHTAIQEYLPGVQRAGLAPDYSGIRPKLAGPDARSFTDFHILWHASRGLGQQRVWQYRLPDNSAAGALVSLLGIESPGLTSSLALGEAVAEELAVRVWGASNPRGHARKFVDDVGDDALDGWA